MTVDDLPPTEDFEAIFEFACSFDGYQHYGSFEACAEAAKSKNRTSLNEIRNELFFAARASRHTDYDSLSPTFRELLPLFRKFLQN